MAAIDISAPGPRVNMAMMKDLLGKRVTLVGRVEGGLQNGILHVKASDEGLVEVVLQGAVPQDAFVEVEGVVESPNTLREQSIIGYGNTFGQFLMFDQSSKCTKD